MIGFSFFSEIQVWEQGPCWIQGRFDQRGRPLSIRILHREGNKTVTELCLRRGRAGKKVLLVKRKKTFMQVTNSNPTLGMDKGTSGPETLFPARQCLARRSFIRSLAISAAATLLVFSGNGQMAQAADGDLDPTFGTGGQVTTDLAHSTDIANAVAVQADGKLVVVGQTYKHNDYTGEDFAVARYNTDGTLDTTFGVNSKVRTDFPGLAAVASSVLVQPDGKILVAGGAFPLFTFLGDFELVRYNPDGSLDTSFGNGGIVTTSFPGQGSYAFALALQSDGKIIAAGTDFVNFSNEDN